MSCFHDNEVTISFSLVVRSLINQSLFPVHGLYEVARVIELALAASDCTVRVHTQTTHCVGYITMVTCTLLHEYTTLVEMVFIKFRDKLGNSRTMAFRTQQSIIKSTQVSSSSRCLPEVVGIPTCILYNKPYSKNACIGY